MRLTNVVFVIFMFQPASMIPLWAGIQGADKSVKTIQGKVIDEATGESLPGARIFIKEIKCEIFADFHGCFSLQLSDEGSLELEINYTSYSTKKIEYIPSREAEDHILIKLRSS